MPCPLQSHCNTFCNAHAPDPAGISIEAGNTVPNFVSINASGNSASWHPLPVLLGAHTSVRYCDWQCTWSRTWGRPASLFLPSAHSTRLGGRETECSQLCNASVKSSLDLMVRRASRRMGFQGPKRVVQPANVTKSAEFHCSCMSQPL